MLLLGLVVVRWFEVQAVGGSHLPFRGVGILDSWGESLAPALPELSTATPAGAANLLGGIMVREPMASCLKHLAKPLFQVSLELAIAALLRRDPFLKALSRSLVDEFYCCLPQGCWAAATGLWGVVSCLATMAAASGAGLRLCFGSRCLPACLRGPHASPCHCGVGAAEEEPLL